MKNNLPNKIYADNFYFWFDKEKKEEYYTAPLYLYKIDINTKDEIKNIIWKETNTPDVLEKYPANIYFPYFEKLGTFLLRFLNADFSNFENAYKTFFFAYGFEILKNLDNNYNFELKKKYNKDTYAKEIALVYDKFKAQIIEIQNEILNAVNFIYNINEIDNLKNYTHLERYATLLIKHIGNFYDYSKNDYLIRDVFSNELLELKDYEEKDLLKILKENSNITSLNIAHKSQDLSSICYAILEELSQTQNYPIKKCLNCKKYFIPTSRVDEIYCDYPKENGEKTCRELRSYKFI